MIVALAVVGVQHAGHGDLRAEAVAPGRQLVQGLDRCLEHGGVDLALMTACGGSECSGQGDGCHIIADRQQFRFLAFEPHGGLEVAAGRAQPVPAGTGADFDPTAVGTVQHHFAACTGSAGGYGVERPTMYGQQLPTVALFESLSVAADDVGQFH